MLTKVKKIPRVLILVFFIALFIRTLNLTTFPMGFHADEAKVAWESLSILKTGKDDHGNILSFYYNTFGDFRPTGIFYTTIPSILIFGKNIFAVRFPSSLLGALTVFPIYYLTLQIMKKNKSLAINHRVPAIFACILLTIIPWHIATSRATSEVVMSCFLILTSLTLVVKKTRLAFAILVSSFLFYHSARVMGPLFLLVWIIYFKDEITKLKLEKKIIAGFFAASLLALILLLSPAGRGRYNQVKLESPTIRNTILQYASYFNPNFFMGDSAKPFRYTTAEVGIVSIPIFLAFLMGLYTILKKNEGRVLLTLFALSPIPAALTLEDSPNLHRSFFMLPFLVIIAAIGANWLYENHKNIFKILTITIAFTFATFLINYFNPVKNTAFQYRDPQTLPLALYLNEVVKNYDKVYITNDPDSPYPWYAFFNQLDPKKINEALQKNQGGKWQYENIIWNNTRCPAAAAFDEAVKDKSLNKIMVVDNGACFTDFNRVHQNVKTIKEFTYNGKVSYRVWEYFPAR